ncbi:MAG: PD40 domain-containing protein [Saprospiraceae bacterium]|nr:PD40 domain-containing protein [Saprospiraceae bacterium]
MKKLIFGFCFWTMVLGVQAQVYLRTGDLDKKTQAEYLDAQKMVRQGRYKDAEKKLDKILKKHPGFYEAALRKAVMFFDQGQFALADPIFDEVARLAPDYDAEMYYAAAINALSLKNDEKAIDHYNQYLQKGQPDEKRRIKVEKELTTLTFRVNAKKNPVPIQPRALEGLINTEDSEYLPSPSLDGKSMVFTRRLTGQEDLYISYQNDSGQWSVAVALETINTPDNEAAQSTSEDGKTIVFTMCNNKTTGFGSCDLYYTQWEDGNFTSPVNMGPRINTPAWESQPCLFANGRMMLFASNRKGSLGGNDLWMVKKTREGKWGAVINLGPKINTDKHEESPFLHSDGKTLYFRSNGHTGMGGFDLFMSKWDDQKKEWSVPVNLGYPINSEGDEGSLAVDRTGRMAYYASDAHSAADGNRQLDLYQFEMPEALRPEPVSYLDLSITDEADGRSLAAQVLMVDVDNGDTLLLTQAEMGKVITALPVNRRLMMHVSEAGYLLHSEHFDTGENFDMQRAQVKTVKMRKPVVTDSRPVILKNIFFASGSAILEPASMPELIALAEMLRSNAGVSIRILGHTDDVGDAATNQLLSLNRAKAVYLQIIDLGIDAQRLSYEGRGESEPISSNDAEEGRANNRRTEFIIVQGTNQK